MKPYLTIIFVWMFAFANAQKQTNYLSIYQTQFNKNLKDWFASYKNLSLNQFKYQSTSSESFGTIDTDTLDKETQFLYKGFLRYSPDKRRVIDLLSGHCVLERKGNAIVDEGCDHGGYIYIWDLRNHTKISVQDMGSFSFYEEGFWLSDTIFVLAYISSDDNSESLENIEPSIFVYDLKSKKRIAYSTGKKQYKKSRNYLYWLHKKVHVAFD